MKTFIAHAIVLRVLIYNFLGRFVSLIMKIVTIAELGKYQHFTRAMVFRNMTTKLGKVINVVSQEASILYFNYWLLHLHSYI